jgi:hypothetical protein
MVGSGRKQTALIKIHVKVESAFARGQLGGELRFVVLIDCPVIGAEILLHVVVERI